jgi:hypothetical protein
MALPLVVAWLEGIIWFKSKNVVLKVEQLNHRPLDHN